MQSSTPSDETLDFLDCTSQIYSVRDFRTLGFSHRFWVRMNENGKLCLIQAAMIDLLKLF